MLKALLTGKNVYGIFGRENAPSTGTEHLQGYIYSKAPKRFTTIKNMFPGAHIERAKGNPAQNIAYCSKDGDVFEINPQLKPVGQGKRTDLIGLLDMAKAHTPATELIVAGDIRSGAALRSYQRIQALVRAPRRDDVRVGWFWGSSGHGKTRAACEVLDDGAYLMANDKGWWDGYDGQRSVIIDDYDPAGISPATLLRILDRYPLTVGGKGTSLPFCGRRIIVTSCVHPEHLLGDRWGECLRRLSGLDEHGRATADARFIHRFDRPEAGTSWLAVPALDRDYWTDDAHVAVAVEEEEEEEEEAAYPAGDKRARSESGCESDDEPSD